MEINTNYIIGGLVFLVLILIFSKIQISTSEGTSTMHKEPSYSLITSSSHNNVGNDSTFLEAQGMPQKNNVMSSEMKAYINSLEDSMYYNNCKYTPNF